MILASSRAAIVRLAILAVATTTFAHSRATAAETRPNIFFAIADDWGYPYAGVYGDKVIRTPTFDALAGAGALFTNAFVSSPSCTPSRAALLTGQWHWRLEENANLHSTLQAKFRTYPEMLAQAGYFTGHSRKAWGPGDITVGGREEDPSGPNFANFGEFLKARPGDTPFCYWFGSSDPHRPWTWQSGVNRGMDLSQVQVPACYPDNEIIRTDIGDYLWEIERFDREVGEALALLEQSGQLENTIIVMTGDHGMPSPRGKSNLYNLGTHVPLAMRWTKRVPAGRTIDDFVSLTDLCPTFLEAAGLSALPDMTARSLMPLLTSDKSGWIDATRDFVLVGKERHVPSQERGNLGGYPSRAIRTRDYLYVRNFAPERWPNGIADAAAAEIGNSFADADNGPTKTYFIEHANDPEVKRFVDLAFAKRPAEELYDLRKDPGELVNVAESSDYAEIKSELSERLMNLLRETADPRVVGGGEKFDTYPYYGNRQTPEPSTKQKRAKGPKGKRKAKAA